MEIRQLRKKIMCYIIDKKIKIKKVARQAEANPKSQNPDIHFLSTA